MMQIFWNSPTAPCPLGGLFWPCVLEPLVLGLPSRQGEGQAGCDGARGLLQDCSMGISAARWPSPPHQAAASLPAPCP